MKTPQTVETAAELLGQLFPRQLAPAGRTGRSGGGTLLQLPAVPVPSALTGAYLHRGAKGFLAPGPVDGFIDGTASPGWLNGWTPPVQLVTFPFGQHDEGTELPTGPGVAPGVGRSDGQWKPTGPGERSRVAVVDVSELPASPRAAAALVASIITATIVAGQVSEWADRAPRASVARQRRKEASAYAEYVDDASARIPDVFAGWLAELPDPSERHAEPYPTIPAEMRTELGDSS